MKTTICALLIAIYLLAVHWSADQRRIEALESSVAGLERIVVKGRLRLSWDKVILDKWTGLDWDRSKPIRKDCKLVTWLDRELCAVYQ